MGRIERAALKMLQDAPDANTREVATAVYGADPTESQMRSTRRAVARLIERGAYERPEPAPQAPTFAQMAWPIIEDLAATREWFTSEDVGEKLIERRVQCWGNPALPAMMAAAARRGLIVEYGITTASRRSSKGRPLRAWRGAGR